MHTVNGCFIMGTKFVCFLYQVCLFLLYGKKENTCQMSQNKCKDLVGSSVVNLAFQDKSRACKIYASKQAYQLVGRWVDR